MAAIPDLSLSAFYGDGSYGAEGPVGNENVTLADISVTMAIGAANYTVGPILPPDADGIMGMAFVQPDSSQ